MKKLLMLPLLGLLALSSCSTMPQLGEMPAGEFEALKTRVNAATAIVSSRISTDWDQAKRDKALGLITKAKEVVVSNNLGELGATNVVRTLVDRYGEALGLDAQAQRDVRDAALLIELVVGPINVDIDGKIDPQEQELVLAFLEGLEFGIA